VGVAPQNGFNGAVMLNAYGLASGMTAGFNPNPTSSTSTLILIAGAASPPGTYPITIQGASGSLNANTTLVLSVTATGPFVSFSPTALTWGKVKVGKKSVAETVTVQNSGVATLDVSSISTTGDFAREAGPKKTDCGNTLAVGASCTVRVTFSPTQKGLRAGSLIFTDNAPASPQSVPLSGTGR